MTPDIKHSLLAITAMVLAVALLALSGCAVVRGIGEAGNAMSAGLNAAGPVPQPPPAPQPCGFYSVDGQTHYVCRYDQ